MSTTTVSTFLSNIKYELNDPGGQNYDNTYLVNILNRGIKILDRELISINSDLVIKYAQDTVTSSNNYLELNNTVDTIMRMYISQEELVKKPMEWILRRRIDVIGSTTGQPKYFSVWIKPTSSNGRRVAFDYTADQDYTIDYIYKELTSALTLTSYMPYDDMFNDYLIEGVVALCQKAKEDKIVQIDEYWRQLFRTYLLQTSLSVSTRPKYYNLDF